MVNKAALVTGGTRGIGKAIALQLAQDGYAVAITGTAAAPDSGLQQQFEQAGAPCIYLQCQLANAAHRVHAIEGVLAAFGRLDVLVNNAGIAPKQRTDVLQTAEESFDEVIATNLKGTFFMTQLAANYMVKAIGEIEGMKPKIINISSVSAYTSSTSRGEYCISKAGISMITALFADRLAAHGINVYEIRPGIIATDMTAAVKGKYDGLIDGGLTPIKRWGTPQDVADAVSVIASGKLGFSTGEVINVDGGFHLRRL